jgi:hypothetical protein
MCNNPSRQKRCTSNKYIYVLLCCCNLPYFSRVAKTIVYISVISVCCYCILLYIIVQQLIAGLCCARCSVRMAGTRMRGAVTYVNVNLQLQGKKDLNVRLINTFMCYCNLAYFCICCYCILLCFILLQLIASLCCARCSVRMAGTRMRGAVTYVNVNLQLQGKTDLNVRLINTFVLL